MSDMNFNRSPVVAVGCGCKKYSGHAKLHDFKLRTTTSVN